MNGTQAMNRTLHPTMNPAESPKATKIHASVYGAMLHHSGFKNQVMSSAGNIKLEAEKFGPDVVSGKVYTAAPRTFEGTTYQFTATFTAPVEKEK